MNKNSLPLSEKIAYGSGDFGFSMFWKLFSAYILFFYTDVFGITAAAAGTMFLVTRIWDTVNDPIMGMKIMIGIIPATLSLAALVFIWFYPLTEKKMSSIKAELEAHLAAETAE
jgi:Na+/melibiose symporter-like transporter